MEVNCLFFCYQILLHKVEATPRISGLHEDIRWRVPQPLWLKYFYPRTRWILTGLTSECVWAPLTWASFPAEVWYCCFFCRGGCLIFQLLLFSDSSWQPSLSHFHIHTYHFLQLADLICESESLVLSSQRALSILILSFLIKRKKQTSTFRFVIF